MWKVDKLVIKWIVGFHFYIRIIGFDHCFSEKKGMDEQAQPLREMQNRIFKPNLVLSSREMAATKKEDKKIGKFDVIPSIF